MRSGAPDHSPEIAAVDAQLKHGDVFAFDHLDLNLVGIIHQSLCDRLKQLLRRPPQRVRRASAGNLALSVRRPSSLRAVER